MMPKAPLDSSGSVRGHARGGGAPRVRKRKRRYLVQAVDGEDNVAGFPGMLAPMSCKYPNKYKKKDCLVEVRSGKHCCGNKCGTRYTPDHVRAIRAYFYSLSKVDRSTFVHRRHRRRDEHEGRGAFFLEPPQDVAVAFAKEKHTNLSEVLLSSKGDQCCQAWLGWCLCVSEGTLKRDAADVNRGVHQNGRPPVLAETAKQWVRTAQETYEVMPNERLTVLPWRTKSSAHAAFVQEEEQRRETGRYGPEGDRYAKEHAAETTGTEGTDDAAGDDGGGRNGTSCAACRGRGRPRCACISSEDTDEPEAVDAWSSSEDARDGPKTQYEKSKYRYGNYLLGLKSEGPEDPNIPTLSHFLRAWREDKVLRSGVVCRKYLPFAKCDICFKHRQEGYHTKDDKKRAMAHKNHRAHLDDVLQDRAVLKLLRQRAARCSDDLMVVAIDGADSKDMVVPKLEELTKMMAEGHQAKMHVYGCVDEGREPRVFVSTDNVKQGHNATIQVRAYLPRYHRRGYRA